MFRGRNIWVEAPARLRPYGLWRGSLRFDPARRAVAGAASEGWWSQTGSNRRPHACKARALPAELWPRNQKTNARSMKVVGLGRLELPTSRLSSARSNQLSYKPLTHILFRIRDLARVRSAGAGVSAPMSRTAQPLARVRPRRKRNEDGEIPPMELKGLATNGP